ncbi:hypothetical protein B0O80DRAFT_108542 [Mortierella sp. GBAus27b]|nr:hypothetical protein B0O80DRAFT_108542 [Mortierella sp. GBAus27b]
MLQAPKMTQKNTNKSSRNHSSSTATSSAWQRTSSTTPQRARADTGGSGLGHLRFSRGQGAGSDQRAHSNRTISSERGDGKLARSTTVMTIHSDSDENEERHAANSTRRKEAKLTRNTTVMTVHTDSEYEEENSQDLETFGAPSMILEEQLISDGLQFTRTGVNVSQNPGSESFGSVNDYLPLTRSTKRKSDRNPKATLNDGATVQGEILFVDPINMLSGEDLIDHGNVESMAVAVVGDDSDCDLSVSQIEQSHGGVSKNMFGSYLLAPMGFDDDEGGSATLFEEAAQIFAGVKEFDESDQLGLGENPHGVVLKNQRRDQERMLENKRRQGKLLLVSLLDNFCLLYEQSPERSRKLFYVICKTLSNMGIIDEEYLEEMSAVRSSYQRAFRSLVLSALTSIKQEQMVLESRRIMAPPSSPTDDGDGISPSSSGRYSSDSLRPKGIMPSAHLHTPPVAVPGFPAPTAMMRTLSFGDMFIGDPTRYNDDFVEICKLGKGGFASVFKARNKLDGIEYAVKKIRLRGGVKVRYEKIFREIRFLARLEHKNVIRYYSSWIEHADYPLSKREMQGGNGTGVLDTHDDLEDEYDDEYMEEEEYTNTTSMLDGSSVSKPFKRRNSTDYFSPHWEQHPSNLEDLSMNIVFGTEEEEDDGISFEDSRGLNNPDDDRESYTSSVSDSLALNNIEDMDSTRSVSSSLSDRRISQAITDDHDERGRISSVESVGVHEETSNWEVLDTSSSFKSRGSLSNSYSALSSSIEEIHRSLPSSNSMLTSRSFSQHYEALAPKGGVIGSGLGAHHGVSRPVGSQRQKLVSRELTLYIQMQLCQTTLQDYLVYRNERPVPISKPEELSKKPARIDRFGILSSTPGIPSQRTQSAPGSPLHQTRHKDLIDPAANRHIFRAIVEGVVYIHDQDMIHRDLKPSNIFLGVSPSLENQRAQQLRQEQPFYDPLQPHPLTTRRSDRSIQSLAPDLLVNDPFLQPLTKEQIQEELFMNIESMIPKIGDFGLVTDMDGGAMLDGDGPQTMDGSQGTGASDSTRPLLSRQSSSGRNARCFHTQGGSKDVILTLSWF